MRKKNHYIFIPILLLILFLALLFTNEVLKKRQDAAALDVMARMQEPSWNMSVTEETVEIDGLKQEYTFLFLTDTHIVLTGTTDSEQVADYAQQRLSQFMNDAKEIPIPSSEQFKQWISYANKHKVNALLLGGDIIDSPSAANIEYLDEQLKKLELPYLYTPGNHDWTFPWDYMTDHGKETYLPMLEPFMQSDYAVHALEFDDLILVAVDNSTNQINPEAMEKYRALLRKNKPVIVMLHVPLLTQSVLTKAKETWDGGVVLGGGNYGGIYPNDTSEEFIELTTAEESPVVAVLAGHVHFSDKDMINEQIIQIVGNAGYTGSAVSLHVKPSFSNGK